MESEKDNTSSEQAGLGSISTDDMPPSAAVKDLSTQPSDVKPDSSTDSKEALASDLYHYTKRGEFTSEIFKIEIQNLPKHFGFGEFKKMLCKLDLKPRKLKAMPRANYAFVTFDSEEERQCALETLNGYLWKRKTLTAKVAKPVVDPVIKKRKKDQEEDADVDTKRLKLTPEEMLVKAVTPLADLPYEEQLKVKQNEMAEFLKSLSDQFKREVPELKKWIETQRKENDDMICELNKIKPSPVLDAYRNKCEFTIGESQEGKDKTVGFRIGSYKGGHYNVANPSPCKNLSPSTLRVVDAFQEYLDQSELSSFDPVTHEGHWTLLIVRSTQGSDMMAMLQMNPQQLSEEYMEKEKSKLKEYFTNGAGKEAGVSSLYLNFAGRKSRDNQAVKCHHICGSETITEDLFHLKFRISHDSFFQINTKAAEVLYDTVGEWAGLSENTTLLDVCCGTGSIGLSLAKKVQKVIGVEILDQAVKDAKANADLNGIKNATFIRGKAEDVLPNLLSKFYNSKDIIGIIDPPRPGIHQKVIHAIRRCSSIKRLVYLSCNPNNARNNFIDLCRPVSIRYKGNPFKLMRAVPVDMFPHTKHCELVLLFERVEDAKASSEKDKAKEDGESAKRQVEESAERQGAENDEQMKGLQSGNLVTNKEDLKVKTEETADQDVKEDEQMGGLQESRSLEDHRERDKKE